MATEASLKLYLCDWLVRNVGGPLIPTRWLEGRRILEGSDPKRDMLLHVIHSVSALDEFAHFNLAIERATEGDFEPALVGFLACAFRQSGDLEAWAYAMRCSIAIGDPEMITAVMATALFLGGHNAYFELRDMLVKQNTRSDLLEPLDSIFDRLMDTIASSTRARAIARALESGDDGRDFGVQEISLGDFVSREREDSR